jgi:hypothetical protein
MLFHDLLQIGIQHHKPQVTLPKDKNILTNNEVDFLQTMHDAVYFRCDNKRYYLKNSVY